MYELMRRVWCGLRGHFVTLHFEPNKLSLACALCGYESEGWEVGRTYGGPVGTRDWSRPAPHLRVVYLTPDRANGPVEVWGTDAHGGDYLVAREVAVGQWERD